MGEASNSSDIFVTDTLINGDLNFSPLSPSGQSHKSTPMVILNANAIDHEESTLKENAIDKINNQLFSAVQVMTNNLHPTKNRTVINVQSKLVLVGIICSLILLFLIPIALYYTDPPTTHVFNIPGEDIKTCSGNTPGKPGTEDLLRKCNITNLTEDCINSSAITSLHTVYTFGSATEDQSCTEDALSFFCNATLFLCSESESHDLSNMCVNVRDSDCALEWRLVETFLNTPVPDCTSFEMDANLTFSKSPLPSCPDQFDIFCDSICLPVCGEYASYRRGGNIFISIWGSIGFIGGIVTLIVCYFNRHKLFRFPQIYTVYNTVVNAAYLLLLVVPNTMRVAGDSSLLCSDRNFVVILSEPTTFCQIQGFLFHFGFLCFLGFWCFHLFHLFHGLAFPYQAKHWMDSKRIRTRIHIAEVVIVLLCGLVPPIITIRVSKYHYDGVLCGPQSATILFYGETVPYTITFVIGLLFLFSCLWILRKKHHLRPDNSEVSKIGCLYCTTAEIKLFLLFFYYGVTMLFIIFRIVTYSQNMDDYDMYTNDYILCSAGGYKEECEIHRENAEASLNVTFVLSVFVGLLISFMNLSHLTYVVNIRKLIRDTKKCMVTCCK